MMKPSSSDKVIVRCNDCKREFEMRKKDLQKAASENQGYVPCWFCHSKSTTWQLTEDGEA